MGALEGKKASKVRKTVDNWRFWMILAWFALGIFAIVLYATYNRTSEQARTQAVAEARALAEKDAEYQRCIDSIPLTEIVNEFFAGVGAFADAAIENSADVLNDTPLDDPAYERRRDALSNLQGKRGALDIELPTPSAADCSIRAYGVTPPPEEASNRRRP